MQPLIAVRRAPVRAAVVFATAAACLACTASPGPGSPAAAPARGLDTLALALAEADLESLPLGGHAVTAERAGEGALVSRIVELAPVDTAAAPFIRLLIARPGTDPRDLIDAAPGLAPTPDLIITRDPGTLGYARSRTDLLVDSLPWDRVHALAVTDPARTRVPVTAAFRGSLAREAVRADARGADSTYAWAGAACSGARAPAARPARSIAHDAGDPTARDLAERLVALDGTVAAAPLPARELAAAVAGGSYAALVVAIPAGAGCDLLPPLPAGAILLPLVETRPHLIRRSATPPLVIRPGEPVRYAPVGPSGG